jgi:hypothetical protein
VRAGRRIAWQTRDRPNRPWHGPAEAAVDDDPGQGQLLRSARESYSSVNWSGEQQIKNADGVRTLAAPSIPGATLLSVQFRQGHNTLRSYRNDLLFCATTSVDRELSKTTSVDRGLARVDGIKPRISSG